MESRKRGFLLVLCTAFISGFSIFINKFAIAQFDPLVFTAMKNAAVGAFVLSVIYLSSKAKELARVSRSEWAKLVAWGAFDGGVAFMLYFYGLKLASPASASLLHKSMFIFASAMAVVFLKESISRRNLAAAALLLVGAVLITGIPSASFGIGEAAMLGAVILWAAGNVVAKKLIGGISPTTIVFARMFFGSMVILGFLAAIGSTPEFSVFTSEHYIWLLLTSILLLGYQVTYFNGLKLLKVSEATSVLALGAVVVTSLLSALVSAIPAPAEMLGMVAITAGLAFVYLFPGEAQNVRDKTVQGC